MLSRDRNDARTVLPIPPCSLLVEPVSLDDVRAVAELAYIWGWPLVNVANRVNRAKWFANGRPTLVDGMPIGYNAFALQTGEQNLDQRIICCPNTSVLYGGGAFILGKKGVVFQAPDFGGAFWLYSLYDARTNQFAARGSLQNSDKGFYLIVGPRWDGINPDPGVFKDEHLIECSTDLALTTARIKLDPPLPPWLDMVNFYPADDYSPGVDLPRDPELIRSCPGPPDDEEISFVHPRLFFRQLPEILDEVDALDDEKELYKCFRKLLKLAKRPPYRKICRDVAIETENTTIKSFMKWSKNGDPAGNGWYTSVNSANWDATQYRFRAATAKSNLFQNLREITRYFFTDYETHGPPLNGRNTYAIKFETALPPAKGPASVTVYNEFHFLYAPPFSVSLPKPEDHPAPFTVYAGPTCPIPGCHWIQTPPNEPYSLYLRAYSLAESAAWVPPRVEIC